MPNPCCFDRWLGAEQSFLSDGDVDDSSKAILEGGLHWGIGAPCMRHLKADELGHESLGKVRVRCCDTSGVCYVLEALHSRGPLKMWWWVLQVLLVVRLRSGRSA